MCSGSSVWVLTTAASQNFPKLCRCWVPPIGPLAASRRWTDSSSQERQVAYVLRVLWVAGRRWPDSIQVVNVHIPWLQAEGGQIQVDNVLQVLWVQAEVGQSPVDNIGTTHSGKCTFFTAVANKKWRKSEN